jgi:transcriptional regulator with XRE-family HTH domain
MATRIRNIRKQRGLTLQQLADEVGTTAQTIQRLETANMTMSLDWLIRIASAMDLTAADLLDGQNGRRLRLLGTLGADDSVIKSTSNNGDARVTIDLPQIDAMAVRLTEKSGDFEPGTLLVAEAVDQKDLPSYDGKPCLVARADGAISLRSLTLDAKGKVGLSSHAGNGALDRNPEIAWIAPVRVAIRYL